MQLKREEKNATNKKLKKIIQSEPEKVWGSHKEVMILRNLERHAIE